MIKPPKLRLPRRKRKTHNVSGPHYLNALERARSLKRTKSTTLLLNKVGRLAVVLVQVGS